VQSANYGKNYAFHCESCNAELVAESDRLASQDIGDGDDNARRRRREKLRDLLQKLDVELKPLTHILHRVKDLEAPDYGTLQAWELRASAVAHASNSDPNANDSSRIGMSGTPMPFLGETKIEVAFSGAEEKQIKSESAPLKKLPPWMIKEGVSSFHSTSFSSSSSRFRFLEFDGSASVGKLSMDGSSLMLVASSEPSEDDEDDDVETFKVDLNVEAVEPSGDDEDDDGIDWEEG
nr:transcription initiation factor IIE subunit alpha [Tanacetum cinerariifolium]